VKRKSRVKQRDVVAKSCNGLSPTKGHPPFNDEIFILPQNVASVAEVLPVPFQESIRHIHLGYNLASSHSKSKTKAEKTETCFFHVLTKPNLTRV